MNRLIIIGKGGHGKVASEIATSTCVFLDDAQEEGVDGRIEDLGSIQQDGDEVFVAIGDNATRFEVSRQISPLATLIHPSAVVSESVTIGAGSIVCAGAIIQAGAVVGAGCIINTGATVDHDCNLGDCVHVSPGAHLGGDVTIGCCTWIGIGAAVIHGVTIGERAMVGAGAVVVSDVPSDVTVLGVPAKEKAQ